MATQNLQIPQISPQDLKQMLEILDKMPNPPALMVYGAPGIGKTSILSDFAKEKNYDLRVKHLSRMDATDWSGIPKQNEGQMFTEFMPISIFKPLEKGKNKIIIFFDELNTAMPQVLNAALDVILEKKGEGYGAILPEDTIILAAGNLGEEDGTYVETLSSAVKTRMIQVRMKQETQQWLEWAKSKNINKTIIDFIEKNNSQYLVDLKGFRDSLDQVATPRGWERISNYMDAIFNNDFNMYVDKILAFKNMVIGTIGKKVGEIFLNYYFEKQSNQQTTYIQWQKDIATAKQFYSKEVASMTLDKFINLTCLINTGLLKDFPSAKQEANTYAQFMSEEIDKLKKAQLTSLATYNISALEQYLSANGYEELKEKLRKGK